MRSPAHYFHLKKKALADFQICISVPLTLELLTFGLNEEPWVIRIYHWLHNPSWPNVPFFYLLKAPKNLWFSSVFRGQKRSIGQKRINLHNSTLNTWKLYITALLHKCINISYHNKTSLKRKVILFNLGKERYPLFSIDYFLDSCHR